MSSSPGLEPKGRGAKEEVTEDREVGGVVITRWYTPWGRALATGARRVATFIGSYPTLVLTLAVGAALVFGLTWIAAGVYDAVSDEDGVAGVDRPVLDYVLTLRSPVGNGIVTALTDTAGVIGIPIIAIVAMLILGLTRKSWTPVILIAAAGGGSLLMTGATKGLIVRNRPPLADAVPPFEHSPSFPSGHTLNSIVVVGIIVYLIVLRRTHIASRVALIVAGSIYAIAIGLSRVYLGHHWFTDVLAGWLLGAAWLALVITAHRLYLTVREYRAAAAPAPRSD